MTRQSHNEKGRVVAIVGRPNVGKSAIFNRLAGRRVAIVHSESGVTRDRLVREVEWDGERFELVDTGGLNAVGREKTADVIKAETRRQAEAALDDAAIVLFVVDIQAGIMPMDEEVAGMLRSRGVTVRVAANKADVPDHELLGAEFERLGFPVFPVSALHRRGFDDLMTAVLKALPPAANPTETTPLRVAIVGKPNAGKSSYVNRLLRSDRVIVSEVPGTTRDSIDVPFTIGRGPQARHYVLSDTAGMRTIGKTRSTVDRFSLFRAEKTIKAADVVVLVLDGVAGVSLQDKKIAALIGRIGRGCVILVNKWDLQAETTQRQYGPQVARTMPFMAHCPIVFASARTGYNIRRSVEAIDHVAAQVRLTLPTGMLNRVMRRAMADVAPPAVQGKRLKVYYAVQTGTHPLRVRLFVNSPRRVQDAYKKYLSGRLRAAFGMEGAPLVLEFRARRSDGKKPRG